MMSITRTVIRVGSINGIATEIGTEKRAICEIVREVSIPLLEAVQIGFGSSSNAYKI